MRSRRGALGTPALALLLACPAIARPAGRADGAGHSACVPLAYVRGVALVSAVVAAPWEEAVAAPVGSTTRPLRGARGKPETPVAADALRQVVADAVAARLGAIAGLAVVGRLPADGPAWWPRMAGARGSRESRLSRPRPAALAALPRSAREAGADAAVAVAADRVVLAPGIRREVWLRLVGYVGRVDGEVLGPFVALGRASTIGAFLGRRSPKSDADLARDAALTAADDLCRQLLGGAERPFRRDASAAVIPAALPATAPKRAQSATSTVRVSSLVRQGDVLFQPDLPPVVEVAPSREVVGAMRALQARPQSVWQSDGNPDADMVAGIGARLKVDYVFASRVPEVRLTETEAAPAGAAMGPCLRRTATVRAEGVLVDVRSKRVVWRDSARGTATAVGEFVGGTQRIRTDEQCVLDAARMAYAFLRFSLDRHERERLR
ncbi:MAG: hypothetical protein IT208_06075 [Chthonomonadales bacterium]|nr:hypothetical protein [Chthonomonadales bacterium]